MARGRRPQTSCSGQNLEDLTPDAVKFTFRSIPERLVTNLDRQQVLQVFSQTRIWACMIFRTKKGTQNVGKTRFKPAASAQVLVTNCSEDVRSAGRALRAKMLEPSMAESARLPQLSVLLHEGRTGAITSSSVHTGKVSGNDSAQRKLKGMH